MNKQDMVYSVVIFKNNQDHLHILESGNYEKCYLEWKRLHLLWTECSKESKPFVLENPIVTAFSPAMIYEISLIPITTKEMSKSHNPYNNQMRDQGFSRTFPNQGRDLLG